MYRSIAFFVAVLAISLPKFATADIVSYAFGRQTANATINVASQAKMQIWDNSETGVDSGDVLFKFLLSGSMACTITQIYWEDTNSLLSSPVFSDTEPAHSMDFAGNGDSNHDMSFAASGAGPSNPPGVSPFTTNFIMMAQNAVSKRGVERQEMAGFLFTLTGGHTFADVQNAIENGDIKVALHIQGIPEGAGTTSDSFLNGAAAIPEPSSLSIVGFMALATVCVRHRR